MEISFTRLRIYLECPWKYKLFFIDGRKIPPTPAAALGLSLHRALERFHRARGDTLDVLLEAFEFKEGGEWREKGRRILRRYFEEEQSRRSEIIGIEREFVYPLGRHTARGMIDRIDRLPDGRVELIDYKAQFAVGPGDPSPAPPSQSLQLRFYALGAREALALDPKLLTVHFLAAGRRESSDYDPSREEELKTLIVKTADQIESSRWGPDTSFCPRCDFRADCAYSAAR